MALADYINNKPTIETDRLVIRPMTAEDVSDLKEWMPDKSIYTYWGKGPGKTEKNPELLFEKENKPTKSFHLGISVKDLDKVIGDLWAEVDIRNVASQRILEKSGFTREGLIRQGKMVNTWCDYYIYGILDSDLH